MATSKARVSAKPCSMSESKESEQHEKDMLSMFASVWVKVEVDEDDENNSENSLLVEHVKYKKKKALSNRNKKTLKCDTCDYTTIYKNCLNLHVLSHTNTKPYTCDACDYTTKFPNSLHRHMMIQHDLKAVQEKLENFNCDECPYTTYFKWNLKAHKRKHKLEKQYKCDHCNYATAYRHNYKKHSKVHNKQEVIFKCDKCPFVTKYEGHISRHLAKIHNEVSEKANKCDLCDFSTKVRWRLNVHKRRSKQKDVIKCSSCEFETSYMCESKKHKSIHYNDPPDYKLNESNGEITFDAPQYEPAPNPVVNIDDANLSVHEKCNNYMLDPDCEVDWKSIRVIDSKCKDRPYQCIMCKYTSRFKASVQRHFQRHHTGNENRPYKCVNCDFSTKTKDQIALHNKRSQSESELTCRECPFTTLFKCQFVTHQKCHYPHKCTECNYSCKHKYEIQKHVSTMHMGNGLKCRFCDFKAARKESLLCHETIHTGNKPFKCKYCDYKSVRKSLLDNHVKRHHSDICQNPVIVADNKIESLKIPVGDKVISSEIIQNIREQNISLEDILDSPGVKDFDALMSAQHKTTNGLL